MRGRGGWPAPCAQSISWRRLRVDNAAGVRCQWRASLACGFWSRRNVVSITGFLAIPRREKLWYLFGAAAGLFPLGCLVLVIGPRRYWKTYSSFLFCNPAPAVISVRSCGKAGSHSFLRTSDRVLDQPGGGMASNTG